MKQFFQSKANFLSFLIALIPAILFYIFDAGQPVSYGLFAIIVLICIALIWFSAMTFLDCLDYRYQLQEHHPVISFKILGVSRNHSICLCESNYSLSQDAIVSFYLRQRDFEHLIGYGIVINVQEDKKIQIAPYKLPDSVCPATDDTFLEYLAENQNNIVIKPTITITTINSLRLATGGNENV